MSVSVYSEDIHPTFVRRRYLVTLTDNLAGVHEYVKGMYDHQPDNDGSSVEADTLQSVKDEEIRQWGEEMNNGGDPAHIDMGGWFTHSEPLWNTWEECLDGSLTPFFQSTYMQDLLICQLTCNRLTKQELEAVAGKNNDVLGEQSIASNTQVELDTYATNPILDEDGNPRV